MSKGITAAACLLYGIAAQGATPTMTAGLADLSLEQLGNIVVTSVSRREAPLSQAAASVYVITGEEIRRSGRPSLGEVLRLAPNLDVARVDANQYAISARGFNNTLANKLLVMIDGRTIYTPLFSGTFWEAQDVMLEDVERIEVISGPGATLWGANAVNGVINIITRPAAATQGTLTAFRAGEPQQDAAGRFGAAMPGGNYRVYGKTVRRDHTSQGNGVPIRDQGEQAQGGFRADWGRSGDGFTLQGDAYEGAVSGQGREYSGLNVLGRWTRDLGEGAYLRVQAYYDRTTRNHAGVFREELDTYDLEAQHALARRGAHRLLWGFGVRQHDDRVQNSPAVVFTPADWKFYRNHVFVQDEIALRPDLDLTLGAKLDYNSYTGNEFLPSARLGWRVSQTGLLWTALSRAVRAPSRVDRDLSGPLGVPPLLSNTQFTSEVAKVAELGYRGQPTQRLSYSVTGFYTRYEKVRTVMPTAAGNVVANDREGENYGIEAWGSWRASDRVRLHAGVVRQELELRERAGTVNVSPGSEGNDPPYWMKLRASIDLTPEHELDLMARHYASRPNPHVPDYTALDVRLAWRAAQDVEVALLAQNLNERRHPEWGPAFNRAELERALYLTLRLGI